MREMLSDNEVDTTRLMGRADETGQAAILRTDLRSQIVARLRANIVSGEFNVSQVYSTAAIAKSIGVSITPVREAVLDIEHSGLIEIVRNRGFRVLSISDGDLDDICDLRKMLEAPAMAIVAKKATDSELSSLRPILDRMKAASERNLAEFLHLDHMFHIRLMELTGNTRLVRFVENLRDQTRLYGIAALLSQGALIDTNQEHDDILQALIKRDADVAVELMRMHVNHTRGIWAGQRE